MSDKPEIDLSPNFARIRRSYQSELAKSMQTYLDEAPVESNNFLVGLDCTQAAAVELFNDFLLYLNDGEEPPVKVK